MHRRLLPLLLLLCLAVTACQPTPAPASPSAPSPPTAPPPATAGDDLVAQGEYLVRIGGCNDCHTPGYGERDGDVPQADWLVGSPVGFQGPWGTSYPSNLRLTIGGLSEAEWLAYTANLHTRPIMPDFMLRQMHEQDRRAIYRFVRSLGTAGTPAPQALPPGQVPPPPYFQLVLPAPAAVATVSGQKGQKPVQ